MNIIEYLFLVIVFGPSYFAYLGTPYKVNYTRLAAMMEEEFGKALFPQVQTFHFFSGPWSSSQEFKAGFNAGVFCETI